MLSMAPTLHMFGKQPEEKTPSTNFNESASKNTQVKYNRSISSCTRPLLRYSQENLPGESRQEAQWLCSII